MRSEHDLEGCSISSESSGDEDLVYEAEMTEEQQKALELVVASSASPYNYDLHLQAIAALSGDPMLASQLQTQFSRFHEAYPLTLELWQQYLALAPEQLPVALKDYLQPALYYMYIDSFDDNFDDDMDEAWSTVLTALGPHWCESEKVYGLYRAHLRDTITDAAKLSDRLKSSYESQLAIPLFEGSDRVLSEYRAWSEYESHNADALQKSLHSISSTLARSKGLLHAMAAFESQLDHAPDVATLQSVWLQYTAHLTSKLKVVGCSILLNAFERAVASVCLSSVLWEAYLDFLADQRMYGAMVQVAMRAVRNVPFAASAWTSLLLALECNGGFDAYEVILDELEGRQALSLDQLLVVLLAYCDTRRRTGSKRDLAAAFARCQGLLTEYPAGASMLRMYAAKCMVPPRTPSAWTKHVAAAWDAIIANDGTLATWQACIAESLRAGAPLDVMRKYYKRGIAAVTDYPGVLAEAYVLFEREMGDSVQDVLAAQKLCVKTQAKQAHEAPVVVETAEKNESKKRKLVEAETQRQDEYKRQRTSDADGRTVFLCNLDKATTKEDLEALFAPCGSVTDVRLLLRNRESQASRGMAYVEFESPESVPKALALHESSFQGTPLNIQPSKPTAKPTKVVERDGVWSTNPTTLYVAKINDQVDEAHVRAYFGTFGAIRAVMILGRKKEKAAYALVEYEAEQSVLDALVADGPHVLCDGTVSLKKARFSVADMVAQQAKSKANMKPAPTKAFKPKATTKPAPAKPDDVASTKPATRIAMPRTSLVPRALRGPKASVHLEARPKAVPAPAKIKTPPAASAQVEPTKAKSNADFRKLFMQS
ncbi:hypothetical protein SPRG_01768 [Saprolegnia parasitica CBS 223.65]|uniref:RRM domain-containing protein n=1 Tax=Saprolegnia parasitica (strain CBS 223.65) TaxID=695850 RepID=A0A067CTQ3_SAPPC|nr:hypothetical protein SPRG_01768 [Saprolegnia parasitica CBS 223.65]KDO33888.1 hypothetical protein SPRG_01768 [Saprolegnia parasitica CBS 223.65]|eukprot:XP_012195524.1 hypothetical protein SPRG_01768 [Saprolegnia parasitica CBS 223.65]